jgi:hypothetical protein
MPRLSTLRAQNAHGDQGTGSPSNAVQSIARRRRTGRHYSTGDHVTKRRRDANKAAKYKVIRDHYETRSRFWRS